MKKYLQSYNHISGKNFDTFWILFGIVVGFGAGVILTTYLILH